MSSTDSLRSILEFLAHFLFILAAWTLVIKFAFPISFAIAEEKPLATYIYWDFWWVAHIALGYVLLGWKTAPGDGGDVPEATLRLWYWFAMIVSLVEIAIIVVKFTLFAMSPYWSIWKTNWFINKIFVLICFCMMFVVLVRYRSELLGGSDVKA